MSIGDRSKAEILDHLRVVEAQLDISRTQKSELLTMLREAAAVARECEANTTGTPTEDFFRRKADSWECAIAKAEGRV